MLLPALGNSAIYKLIFSPRELLDFGATVHNLKKNEGFVLNNVMKSSAEVVFGVIVNVSAN